jgi:hypothetical protein
LSFKAGLFQRLQLLLSPKTKGVRWATKSDTSKSATELSYFAGGLSSSPTSLKACGLFHWCSCRRSSNGPLSQVFLLLKACGLFHWCGCHQSSNGPLSQVFLLTLRWLSECRLAIQ